MNKESIPRKNTERTSSLDDMQHEMRKIINLLLIENQKFEAREAFEKLIEYIKKYDRILYAAVSNAVFDLMNADEIGKEDRPDKFGTLQANIEQLIDFVDNSDNINAYAQNAGTNTEKECVMVAKRSVWKLWDHVNLSQRQYIVIYSEYDHRIDDKLNKYQSDISKDVTNQLLTIVSIFTALAFLLFGGISSLDNLFTVLDGDNYLLRILIVACVWSLGLLNIIFVFLFCISKMTKVNFKSTHNTKASIWQRYPIVWWTNFCLVSLSAVLIWLYFCKNRGMFPKLNDFIRFHSECATGIGIAVLGVIFLLVFCKLKEATKPVEGNEDEL